MITKQQSVLAFFGGAQRQLVAQQSKIVGLRSQNMLYTQPMRSMAFGSNDRYKQGGNQAQQQYMNIHDRLQFNGKRIYLRQLNFIKEKQMMNMNVKQASFAEKNDSFQVHKNGYIIIDFTPIGEPTEEQQSRADVTNKKTFIVTLKNMGEILSLDTTLPYNKETDDEGVFIQYQAKEDEPIRVMKMNKQPNRHYKFTYCEIFNGSEVKNNQVMDLSFGEVIQIKSLLEYSMPYLLGWQALMNPSIVTGGN
eukprot:403371114